MLKRMNKESRKMSLKTCSVSISQTVVALVHFFFQDFVSDDVEISQVKRFDMFMNYYHKDSRQYQYSVGFCTILFP